MAKIATTFTCTIKDGDLKTIDKFDVVRDFEFFKKQVLNHATMDGERLLDPKDVARSLNHWQDQYFYGGRVIADGDNHTKWVLSSSVGLVE